MREEAWADEVIGFWFSLDPEAWWKSDPELDEAIRTRFLELWEEQTARPVEDFLVSPRTTLAAILLFDQLPRNMFRGDARSYASDHMALAIAKAAVDREYDEAYVQPERGFFYMPFQHSEVIEDQRRSLTLFTALGDPEQLRFARHHHDVIERFGRFPHRNEILGRSPRPDEVAAGDVTP